MALLSATHGIGAGGNGAHGIGAHGIGAHGIVAGGNVAGRGGIPAPAAWPAAGGSP